MLYGPSDPLDGLISLFHGAGHAACKRLGLRQIFPRPYTPKTNGKAERFI
jgi:hypothetical protein